MAKYSLAVVILLFASVVQAGPLFPIFNKQVSQPVTVAANTTDYTPTYVSTEGEEDPDEEIQVPIPKEDRVPNYTRIQCVWSSIECIGRWAEEPKLINPPLTSRKECKSYAGPDSAAAVLTKLNVKFEQTSGSKAKGRELIKKAMAEGRGCLFDVPGHAMTLVHYDEDTDTVKWIDNSDKTLKIQTMTVKRFNERWGGWVLVIYADNDIVASKIGGWAKQIPVAYNNKVEVQKDLILMPRTVKAGQADPF